MATSGDILNQLNTVYDPTNVSNTIENGIRDSYKGTIENLMRDASDQMGRAYGTMAGSFAEMGGPNARSMSPAARMARAIHNANEGMRGLDVNRGLRDFYRTSINDSIGKGIQTWQMGRQGLLDQYNMLLGREQDAYQKEQDAWQRSMAERQLSAQYAAQNSQAKAAAELQRMWDEYMNKNIGAPSDGSGIPYDPSGKMGSQYITLPDGRRVLGPSIIKPTVTTTPTATNKVGNRTIPNPPIP